MPARDRLPASQLAMHVSCPNCRADMTLRTVIPVMSPEEFLEITYACPACEGETKRQVKDGR
jgi:hypothetical protein